MTRRILKNHKTIILGAGIAGLSAGVNTNNKIYEANGIPGGICLSYYMNREGKKLYFRNDEETYRFEIGGGHWIFGANKNILNFINFLSPVKSYERKSAVYFPDWNLYVPYPLQNHLSYLPKEIAVKALDEITKSDHSKNISTLADWLLLNFGKTLCEIFFYPFHKLYTANLFEKIAPQDRYKTPIDKNLIFKGAKEKTPSIGYNATFVYPKEGLDDLIRKMTKSCKVNYTKKVIKIDVKKKEVFFEDGAAIKYENLFSSIPLDKMTEITQIGTNKMSLPYTSVLVINIGARKGVKCPDDHWLYIPKSKSGFHRVGFYSNVDTSFLPASSRKEKDKVSIYVEKAYMGGEKPSEKDIKILCDNITRELQEWKFIDELEVIDPTWIDIAYTWEEPGSDWKDVAIGLLEKHNIYQIGRYGRWVFQGIASSIEEGLALNPKHKNLK